jgi:hypothetical protein
MHRMWRGKSLFRIAKSSPTMRKQYSILPWHCLWFFLTLSDVSIPVPGLRFVHPGSARSGSLAPGQPNSAVVGISSLLNWCGSSPLPLAALIFMSRPTAMGGVSRIIFKTSSLLALGLRKAESETLGLQGEQRPCLRVRLRYAMRFVPPGRLC